MKVIYIYLYTFFFAKHYVCLDINLAFMTFTGHPNFCSCLEECCNVVLLWMFCGVWNTWLSISMGGDDNDYVLGFDFGWTNPQVPPGPSCPCFSSIPEAALRSALREYTQNLFWRKWIAAAATSTEQIEPDRKTESRMAWIRSATHQDPVSRTTMTLLGENNAVKVLVPDWKLLVVTCLEATVEFFTSNN